MALSPDKNRKAAPLEVIKHELVGEPALEPCFVLKAFNYSHDGFTERQAAEGEVVDIPSDLIAGLEAEGYVSRGEPEPPAPAPREASATTSKARRK